MSIKTWSKWHDAAKKEFHRGMLKVLSKFHIIIRPEILTKNFKLFFKLLCITLRSVMKVPPKLFQFVFTMMMMMMMMMMMSCFCGMVDRRKTFSLISSRDHCQRFSPLQISDTPQAGFELAQNLSSGLVE